MSTEDQCLRQVSESFESNNRLDAYPITDGSTIEVTHANEVKSDAKWEPGPSELKRLAVEELVEHGYDKIDAEQALR